MEPLDLRPAFQRCARDGEIALDTLHPNVRGHRCAAQALARALEEPPADEARQRLR